jgi:hypothetical protein
MAPFPRAFTGCASTIVATTLLGACAPTTRLASSWVDPTQIGHAYRKIAVVGATPQPTLRRQYEGAFVAELERRGTSAVASFALLGEGQAERTAAAARFQEGGVEAVIVTRLVDRESYHAYVPSHSATPHTPPAASGGWYGAYSMGYSHATAVGDSAANQVYRLESDLYDLASDRLVWSGITETVLQAGDRSDDEIRPVIDELLTSMQKSKALPTSKP